MKNLTKSLLALLTVAFALSFTSCLNSDDDNTGSFLQPGTEEYASYLTLVSGTYSGLMYFYNDTIKTTSSNQSKVDSVQVSADVIGVRDSMIYTRIPANYFLKSVKGNEDLVEAIGSMPIKVSAKFYLYQVSGDVLFFGVYPFESTVQVKYGDANHDVNFEFVNSVNYWGAYKKNVMQVQMILSKIKVDGKVIKQFSQEEMQRDAIYLLDVKKIW